MWWILGAFLVGLFGWGCCRPRVQNNYYYNDYDGTVDSDGGGSSCDCSDGGGSDGGSND